MKGAYPKESKGYSSEPKKYCKCEISLPQTKRFGKYSTKQWPKNSLVHPKAIFGILVSNAESTSSSF